ncbi:minor tail protein [Microbacterium phage MonChoix]|uniref:Minor tail protein n=1 Tax=Microbacterium phage MonChoix TaxID=2590880 RepID=A0A4Y6EC32_9CAUD|nr:minor tail protein [Microbacterium phage MonChoix]QDF15982.1 minor tail protein [Microbacterium phage MonChoix]
MSFKLGTFDTSDIDGFKAILTEWPALPVESQFEVLPGGDGALYYRSRMTETEWVFNLELTGSDVDDVMAKADEVSRALNPLLHGLQDFTPNAAGADWVWQGVLSEPVPWERDSVVWFAQDGVCRLASQATILTPNPYGVSVGDPTALSVAGAMTLVGEGNTSYYPVVEFRGVLSAAQTLTVGGTQVTGPLTAAQTLVLDFGEMDFYIKTTATGAKVRNIADRFITFERLEGIDTINVPVSISGGTFTQAVGTVPSRRI